MSDPFGLHLLSRQQNDLLTVPEVARILRACDTTVKRWIRRGALEAVILPKANGRQAYHVKRETLKKVLGGNEP